MLSEEAANDPVIETPVILCCETLAAHRGAPTPLTTTFASAYCSRSLDTTHSSTHKYHHSALFLSSSPRHDGRVVIA